MDLYYYSKVPNFGDTINPEFWDKFIGFSRIKKDSELMVGMGTILNNNIPKGYSVTHVMGSGAGYGKFDSKNLYNFKFHFVRGPITAKLLEIDNEFAITDPGILLSDFMDVDRKESVRCGFIPHVGIDSDRLKVVVEDCGLSYISPKLNPSEFIRQVARCDRVICSAMHGAILADSLRIPWYPISTSNEILELKWQDWALSLQLDIKLNKFPVIWRTRDFSFKSRFTGAFKEILFARGIKKILQDDNFHPSLNAIHEEKKSRVYEKLEGFLLEVSKC
jgi:succinoglycan biosynthesis protein ExoV